MGTKQEIIQQKAHALMLAIIEAYPCMTEEAGIFAHRTLVKEMTPQEADNVQTLYVITSRVALSGFGVSRSLADTESHQNEYHKFLESYKCSSEQK